MIIAFIDKKTKAKYGVGTDDGFLCCTNPYDSICDA